MSLHTKDSAKFQLAKDTYRPSLYEGMPLGIQSRAEWLIKDLQFNAPGDIPVAGTGWTITLTGAAGALAITTDLVPPRLTVTTDALDNDSVELQFAEAAYSGEHWGLRTGKRLYFRCRFSLSDAVNLITTVQQADLFLGLSIRDTAVIDGATDFIGFSKVDGSGVVNFVAGKNAGAGGVLRDQIVQSTGVTLVAADAGVTEADMHTFEFVVSGTNEVNVYADGTWRAKVRSTTQLPDDENLCETIALQNGEAVVKVMNISQFLVAMER